MPEAYSGWVTRPFEMPTRRGISSDPRHNQKTPTRRTQRGALAQLCYICCLRLLYQTFHVTKTPFSRLKTPGNRDMTNPRNKKVSKILRPVSVARRELRVVSRPSRCFFSRASHLTPNPAPRMHSPIGPSSPQLFSLLSTSPAGELAGGSAGQLNLG